MFSASKSGQYPGYLISRSVRLRSSASAYFSRTFGTATNSTIYTFSTWTKRGLLGSIKPIVQGYLNNNNYGHIIFKADDTIEWREVSVAANYGQINTNAVFRDPSAWYHIVVVRNGTSLTIYVNNVSQTLTVSTAVNSAPGYLFGTSTAQRIGSDQVNSAFFDGYLTEVNFIDGQALTPSSFGVTNAYGVWSPTKYNGTYGTNGFYLNFSDNSAATAAAIGKDYSGNGNNWTPNNISVTAGVTYDSMLDVPTQWADGGNGRGNYATWNPLDKNANGSIAGGNLNNTNGSANNAGVRSTFALPQSGKWYAELVVNASTSGTSALGFGFATATADMGGSVDSANKYDIYGSSTGSIFSNTTSLTGSLGAFTASDILQIAYDGATGKAWVGKNNTWYNSSGGSTGDPANGTNQTFTLSGEFFLYSYYYNTNASLNCGQRPFTYTPPSGFVALNTLNLPTPTINNGALYMAASIYTGTGANLSVTNTVNNVSFQPDLVWVKGRSGATDHALYDAVRGVQLQLESNTTTAETTETTGLTAFNSNGFTVGALAQMNTNTATYVGWQWKEGATQGFDIVTYTGNGANRTIAHNLGVAPSMIIIKNRSQVSAWIVGHQNMAASSPWNGFMQLNQTAAYTTSGGSLIWNNTAPTSSVFSVGTDTSTNFNGNNFVAYLFAEVAGFSKFGSYTGNGSTDGPFVFCGFRPRFVMTKRTDTTGPWQILDTARDTYNSAVAALFPNTSGAEASFTQPNGIDYLSNGFKLRNSSTDDNANGGTYIFAAFCENPFKNALAR